MTPADLPPGSRRPVRLSLTLPRGTYDRLVRAADHQARSLSNLAAHLIDQGLDAMDP